MSHASPRVETATNRLQQELFARPTETPAYDLCAMATDVNRMGYFKSASLRIRETHQYPLWNTAFGSECFYFFERDRMRLIRRFLGTLLWLSFVSTSSAQDRKAANPAAVPPNLLVLVHQEIQSGKTNERQKLVAAVSRACDRLDAPSFWIDLQSLTGNRETLTFDLFYSYEHLQEANSGWRQFYAAHSDLAQTQGQIDSLVSSERTIVALRRDDLSAS